MELRSRNKRKLISIKQEITAIDFTFETEKPSLTDNNNILKYRSYYLNLKEEDSTNKTFIEINQISNFVFKNEDKTEIKQKVTAEPEALLHEITGMVKVQKN